jgi:hypothetical protein
VHILAAMISVILEEKLAIPGKRKVVEALRKPDLLVQVDLWMSETARLAHYVIAPTVWLEAVGITLVQDYSTTLAPGYGYEDSYAQRSPAVALPPDGADVMEEWQFFYRLARQMGITVSLQGRMTGGAEPIELDVSEPPGSDDILSMLAGSGRVPLAEIKRHDGGALFPDPTVRVAPQDPGWTGRLELGDAGMLAALRRFEAPGAGGRVRAALPPRRPARPSRAQLVVQRYGDQSRASPQSGFPGARRCRGAWHSRAGSRGVLQPQRRDHRSRGAGSRPAPRQ